MSLLSKALRNHYNKLLLRNNYETFNNSLRLNNTQETHFGFQNVTKNEKAKKVYGVFENVADNYDLMNDVMSAGIHRLWKDQFITQLSPIAGIKLLDVAGGTGDITFRVLQYLHNDRKMMDADFDLGEISSSYIDINYEESLKTQKEKKGEGTHQITVCDISQSMLDVGKKRAEELGYHNIEWICGDAQDLPFKDNSYDVYTIAFGMRNVVDISKALDEAYRVLKPGGQFLCLEFSHVNNDIIRKIYDSYSFEIIPVMGQVVAADWDSYQYLVESIRKFPDQELYKQMIEDVGFRRVRYRNLTFGVCAIHSGFKI